MGQLRLIQTHVCLVVFMLVATRVAALRRPRTAAARTYAAARILRPLADDAREPDPLAQYFMAMLYDSGRGVV